MAYELPTCECVQGQSASLADLLKNIYCAIYAGGAGGGLPDQSGHAGEFLTTDGTDASWVPLAGGGDVVASGVLANNAVALGGGGTTVKTTTTGTGVVTALGVNVGSAGAFVVNGGALGTPSSGTLSSCTGLPVATGISGLGTGVATALAVNVGTAGAFVVNGGALGTPSSGTLTNCTGLPGAGVSLTATQIAYGGAGGTITSEAAFTYNAGTNTLSSENANFTGTVDIVTLRVGGSTGVSMTATNGVLTMTGVGPGQDESLTFNFDSTANTVVVTSGSGVTLMTFATIALSADNITANTAFLPDANDGAALGTTALQFSDLFLAEGGVINWDNGDCTLTQSGNTLTVAGAEFIIDPASGPTSVSAGGFRGIPQNSQSAAYTTVLADAGKHILHPASDNNARTFTIDSNANVAYPIGTAITFINEVNVLTIAITSDTLVLAGAGTTGSRTLAANGIATAVKIASTTWIINGTGLT